MGTPVKHKKSPLQHPWEVVISLAQANDHFWDRY